MDDLRLKDVDVDGAVQEAADRIGAPLNGDTRLGFLRKAGAVGGALVGGGALLSVAAPAASAQANWPGQLLRGDEIGGPPAAFGKGDIGILNFALTLEYLESSFYNEATAKGAITDPATAAFLATTTRDENSHVAALKLVLGSNAISSPWFDFKGIPEDQALFQKTAYSLENTGVHAYLGQLENFRSKVHQLAAGSIAIVEGRHAAVIGSILNDSPEGIAPDGPFDIPLAASSILSTVASTGFITGGLPTG